MTISRWFIHFGVPGYYEGAVIQLTNLESYRAMAEAFKIGQYAAYEAAARG